MINLNDNWIDCEDRLPERKEYVLVWYEYFRYGDYNCMWRTYGLAYYYSDYQMWFGEDLNGTDVKVLAWQPLPTLPSKYRNEMENEYEQIE